MSEPLWTLDAVVAATGGRVLGEARASATGISIDSRSLADGDIFFAIQGEARDGHQFVGSALARGAAFAIVREDHIAALHPMGRYVLVEDVMAALEALARAARARSAARIVAVTGSVGKTSTKEALRLVLGAQGETHAATASFNNHLGVPITLSSLPASARYGVFEIGMNHAGEITPLTKMVRPHVAIVTTVAPVHLEFFEDGIEGIARAKAEIFAGLEPGGTAVINRDIEQFPILADAAAAAGAARVVTFGEHDKANSRIEAIAAGPDGSSVSAIIDGHPMTYKVGAPGKHIAFNSLAVMSAVAALGADLARGALALADLAPAKGRGQRHDLTLKRGKALLIDESYNANPASVRAALDLLAQADVGLRGRRIAVLGDMLELGEAAEEMHAGLADAVEAASVDRLYCAGPLMRALYDAVPSDRRAGWGATSADILEAVVGDLQPGDAIMIKGSLGSRMAPIVDALRTRYSKSDD